MYKQIINILINPSQFTANKRRGTFPWVKSSHLDVGPDAEYFVYLREQEYFDELNIFLFLWGILYFLRYCIFEIFSLMYSFWDILSEICWTYCLFEIFSLRRCQKPDTGRDYPDHYLWRALKIWGKSKYIFWFCLQFCICIC